jgi:catechol 2,3-dioxygenase-like lactoylglutathione lyase family enzyme
MKLKKIDHVGIIVNDLEAAKAFFLDLGLVMEGEAELEGEWLEKIVGLRDVKDAFAFLRTPDGVTGIELIRYYSPPNEQDVQKPASNTHGIRHISFVVDGIEAFAAKLKNKGLEFISDGVQQAGSYKLCFVRGPEGIILELDEQVNNQNGE